jgi:DNA polymerase
MPTDVFSSKTYDEFKKNLIASNCSKCPELCAERHNIVVDRGRSDTPIAVIGEGPGENEDLTGKAFVGRGGQLFDQIMATIGIDTNKNTLIMNVVKCRPPKNRQPKPIEAENCMPYLKWQLNFVKPRVVILLGAIAVKYFLPETKEGMKARVGRFFDVPEYPNTKFMPLFHPAYLLRDPRKKPETLEHVKSLRAYLEKENLLP